MLFCRAQKSGLFEMRHLDSDSTARDLFASQTGRAEINASQYLDIEGNARPHCRYSLDISKKINRLSQMEQPVNWYAERDSNPRPTGS